MSVPFTAASALRVLCLGDSVTALYPTENYRAALGSKLRSMGCNVDFVGAYSDTLPSLSSCYSAIWGVPAMQVDQLYIDAWMAQATPDVVLMLLGANDIQLFAQTPDATIASLTSIIGKMRAINPSVQILLGKYPPIRPDIPNFAVMNNSIPELAASLNTTASPVILVDHSPNYDITVGADNGDLTHPNANGNRKYANNWFIAMVNQGLCPAASVLYNIALDKPINALPSTDQPTDLGSLFWIVNGGINDGLYWQRIAATADQTLEIDLQGNYSVSYFELNHFGSSVLASVDVSNAANTSTYQIQLSANHDTWTTIAAMTNNSLGRTVHIINPTPARYVRLIFNAPFYLNTIALREFRVLGIPITVP